MKNIILFNKPIGQTSNDIVQLVKRITESFKAGHAGTLDPLASGLLIIGINEGTKQLSSFLNLDKEYVTTIKFGEHRDTFDREGKVIEKNSYTPTIEEVEKAITYFNDLEYEQKVPIYSSVKIKGKKLYEYARKNIEVDCPSKKVKIHNLCLLNYDFKKQLVEVRMNVSKGFYVRSFAVDFAKHLNTCGFIYHLKRTKIGNYNLEDAIDNYEDLWKYHSKVFFLNKESTFESDNSDLVVGHFDILHLDQKKFFKRNDFNVLTFINNPGKKFFLNSMLLKIHNLNFYKPRKIFVYDIKNSNLSSNDFNNLVKEKINPDKIVIGANFKYGMDQENFHNLKKDFAIEVINNKLNTNSTSIRNLLEQGSILEANKFLLNFFKIKGVVVMGNQKGRLINFPTANFNLRNNLKIKTGSYVSLTKIGKNVFASTTFIWENSNNNTLIETFIHDFNSNLYGRIIEVWPIQFIENFRNVSGLDELALKIKKEVSDSKKFHELNQIKSMNDYLKFLEKNKDI